MMLDEFENEITAYHFIINENNEKLSSASLKLFVNEYLNEGYDNLSYWDLEKILIEQGYITKISI